MPQIPTLLERLVDEGRWPRNKHDERAQRLRPLLPSEQVRSFAPEERELHLHAAPWGTIAERVVCGETFWDMPCSSPKGLDRELAVVIGDFGLGSDAPLVLDYRAGAPPPRVMRLRWGPTEADNEWVEVAPSFEAFVALLGL